MKKKMTILAVLVAAVVITGYSVAGTYAKYTEEFSSETSTANVAKWAFTINDTDTKSNKEFKLDLFANATNTSLTTEAAQNNSEGEQPKIIAPGSKGSATIKVQNNSEVKAKLAIDLSSDSGTATGIPLEYKVKVGENYVSLDDAKDLSTADWSEFLSSHGESLSLNNNSSDVTITIEWEWPEDDKNDGKTDTPIGENSAKAGDHTTVVVTANVTATQDFGE